LTEPNHNRRSDMAPKKRKDPKLPKYVCKGTSAYLYIPYAKGKPRKSYRLCNLDATHAEIWAAFAKFTDTQRTDTLEYLLNRYMNSPAFTSFKGKPKADKTITEHRRQIELICNYPSIDGDRFGLAYIENIKPSTIKTFLDWRLENGGGIAGNHEVAIISKAWNWARERDVVETANPCIGVTRNPKTRRQHYADDTNYNGWLKYLEDNRLNFNDGKKAPEYLYIVSELAYLCIAKRSERGRFSQYLVLTNEGKTVTERGFNSTWQRHMIKAIELGFVEVRFTTHDLKRKGATDSDQDATISTGNSPEMSKVYDVSKINAEPTK